jgi:hypothetical protein
MEGRQHGKLKLDGIASRNLEGHVTIIVVLGKLNAKDLLRSVSMQKRQWNLKGLSRTVSFLTR